MYHEHVLCLCSLPLRAMALKPADAFRNVNGTLLGGDQEKTELQGLATKIFIHKVREYYDDGAAWLVPRGDWSLVSCCSCSSQPGPQCVTEHHVPSHPTHEPRAKAAETMALAAGSWPGVNHHLERQLNVFSCFPTQLPRYRETENRKNPKEQSTEKWEPRRERCRIPVCGPWEPSLTQRFEEALGLSALVLSSESLCSGSDLGSATHKLYGFDGCEYIRL